MISDDELGVNFCEGVIVFAHLEPESLNGALKDVAAHKRRNGKNKMDRSDILPVPVWYGGMPAMMKDGLIGFLPVDFPVICFRGESTIKD
jgi:hypothetical protein